MESLGQPLSQPDKKINDLRKIHLHNFNAWLSGFEKPVQTPISMVAMPVDALQAFIPERLFDFSNDPSKVKAVLYGSNPNSMLDLFIFEDKRADTVLQLHKPPFQQYVDYIINDKPIRIPDLSTIYPLLWIDFSQHPNVNAQSI